MAKPIRVIRGGSELSSCGMSFKADFYSGCSHNCVYCYAKHLLTLYNAWKTKAKPIKKEQIDDAFEGAFEKNLKGEPYDQLRHKFPLRCGSLTDNFQPAELKCRLTLHFLENLVKYNYPCIFNTKSPIISRPEYVELLKVLASNECAVVQFSLISLNKNLIKSIEPGAPAPTKRLEAAKVISDAGIPVQIRLSPFIPYITTDYEELIKEAKESGVETIISEFFRIPPKKDNELKSVAKIIEEETGINIWTKYKEDGAKVERGYLRYPFEKRYRTYRKLKKLAEENEMNFYVCGEADPSINDNPKPFACGCGTDLYCGFKKYNTASSNNVACLLKERGKLSLEEVKKELESLDWKLFEKQWNKGVYGTLLNNCKIERKSGKVSFRLAQNHQYN